MNREQIEQANKGLPTINIKGKQYVMVKDRVKAFRSAFPDYTIETEIVRLTETDVVIKATVRDPEGRILATGHAQEDKNASQINRTSFIENCETSALGRVIGLCGIGIDDSFGSADEVASAIHQQEVGEQKITDRERRVLDQMLTETASDRDLFYAYIGKASLEDFTKEDYYKAVKALERKKAK